MSVKSKGINAERDLIHKFWFENIPAVRVAGSGSSKYASPDIIAGTRRRKFVIEVKITKDSKKYLTKDEVYELKKFANLFGAEAWVAIKFKGSEWLFLPIGEIEETEKCFLVEKEISEKKGILFEELAREFKNE